MRMRARRSSGIAIAAAEAALFTIKTLHAGAVITAGSASVDPASSVTIPVSISGLATSVRSFDFSLSFDGAVLTGPDGLPGAAIPAGWSASAFSPSAGTLNALGFDLGGERRFSMES